MEFGFVVMKVWFLVGVVLAACGCKRVEVHPRLEYVSSRWEGNGPNAVARCQFRLSTDSDSPVWVEAGLPTHMVAWQGFDGTGWELVEDFEIGHDGERIGHFYNIAFDSSPRRVSKVEPMSVETTVRRCQIQKAARVRAGIRVSKTVDLTDGDMVYSEAFNLDAK